MNPKTMLVKSLTGLIRIIRLLATGKDNRSPDTIIIGGMLIGAEFLWLAAYSALVHHQMFDPIAFGTGAAAILAAIGTALRLKAPTE